MATERELINWLQDMLHEKPVELQEQAKKMLIASHQQEQHLRRQTKNRSFDQLLILMEENMALAHIVSGDDGVQLYIDECCNGWDEIFGKGAAEELRNRLNQLHALMGDRE
jgi:hypothetical protein